MKRLHIHVSVEDLQESIRFYQILFASEPTVVQSDYAKWMLDDPRMNFAISQRGATIGLDHLGIQVENAHELDEMHARLSGLSTGVVEESGACCYAQSDKYWMKDPSGLPWETFHTLDSVPVFGKELVDSDGSSCAMSGCMPQIPDAPDAKPSKGGCGSNTSGCC